MNKTWGGRSVCQAPHFQPLLHSAYLVHKLIHSVVHVPKDCLVYGALF
jgi:hypothetical protein